MTKRKTKTGQRQLGWSQSARFKAIGSAAIRAWNAQRPYLPKCGAKKRDGGECRNLPLENGRCRLHGGRVPKGDQWHRLTYPSGETPAAETKFRKKQHDHARHAAKRAERYAAMSPEERARHDAWQQQHKPGPGKRRAAARARTAQALDVRELLSRPETPLDPAAVALNQALDEARRRAADLATETKEGIFG